MGLKFRIHPLAAAITLEQLDHLDEYPAGRNRIAAYLVNELRGTPGIGVPEIADGVLAAWYGLPLLYQPDELDGLPVECFFEALRAEGCCEADRPGATCLLNLHPLFQDQTPLFPAYPNALGYAPGDFPVTEQIHHNAIKLPVWHRDDDLELATHYAAAIRTVSALHRDLLRSAP